MNNLLIVFIVVLQMVAGSAARADTAAGAQLKLHGYIVDHQCAGSVQEDPDPTAFLEHHTKDCALMPSCKAEGYSLYANGKWFELDKRGSNLVIDALKASKRNNGFYAEVTGSMQGKVLKVQNVTEIQESQKTQSGKEEK